MKMVFKILFVLCIVLVLYFSTRGFIINQNLKGKSERIYTVDDAVRAGQYMQDLADASKSDPLARELALALCEQPISGEVMRRRRQALMLLLLKNGVQDVIPVFIDSATAGNDKYGDAKTYEGYLKRFCPFLAEFNTHELKEEYNKYEKQIEYDDKKSVFFRK